MTSADLPTVLEINSMNSDDVDALTSADLEAIHAESSIAMVAVAPEATVVGFCLVVDSSAPHRTPRSSWAFDHGADLHLERVAFDMRFSGRGLGLDLFEQLDARIHALVDQASAELVLTSIVQIDPPNEHSVWFHESRGFAELDRRSWDGVTFALTGRTYAATPRG